MTFGVSTLSLKRESGGTWRSCFTLIAMGKKRVLVSYGVDIDAIAGWLGSYKGEDSQSDISRGT